jgi:dihydroorotase
MNQPTAIPATANLNRGPRTGPSAFVLRGGDIIDQSGRRTADVYVKDGVIAGVDTTIDPAGLGAETIDATGSVITPGLIDIQVHFRQPGKEEAETIESGARAAALGGFTAVVCMPNTTPAIDSPSIVRDINALAATAACAVYPAGTITKERKGESLTNYAALAALGVRMFTDDGNGVQDDMLMRRALEYARPLGIVLSQHCEVEALSHGGAMNEGEWSEKLGIQGIPVEAEELMVFRDIALARLTGGRVHFLHLSSAGSVELVRQAKERGIRVTAEAAPHHFVLTDACCHDYNTHFKMNPPLRTQEHVDGIRNGFTSGVLDAIATDHAPHAPHTKELPFAEAPFGIVGVETALSLSLTELGLPIEKVIPLLTWHPAKIAQIDDRFGRPIAVGEPANITVIDPTATWTRIMETSPSKSRNDAFEGRNMVGRARHTIFEGELVVQDAQVQR